MSKYVINCYLKFDLYPPCSNIARTIWGKILKAANLTVASEKLARATAKLEYKDMREKLSRIFGDPGVLEEEGSCTGN